MSPPFPAPAAPPSPTAGRRPSGRRRLPRRDALHLALLVLVWLGLWLPRLSGPLDMRFDAGVYYVLGTSLAEGRGYRLLNEPGEIHSVQYPPLLPLLVAAHQKALGTSDYLEVGPWLRATFLLLSTGLVVATYLLARSLLPPGPALLAAGFATLSANTVLYSDMLYTEMPFALVSVLFALCLRRGRPVAAGALGAAAYLLRTAGLALLAAWVAESLLRRRFRQAAGRAAVALLPIVLWQGYIARVTRGPEFQEPAYAYQRAPYYYSNVTYGTNSRLVDPFTPERGRLSPLGLPLRTLKHLTVIPGALGAVASAPEGFWRMAVGRVNARLGTHLPERIVRVPLWVIFGLVATGTALMARRGEWFVPLYLAASVGMVSLAPWPEQYPRYFTPLTPFLTVAGVLAVTAAVRRWEGPRRGPLLRRLAGALVVGVLSIQGYALWTTFRHAHPRVLHHGPAGGLVASPLLYYDRSWRALDQSLEWVRRHAAPGAVIATTEPHTAFVKTGHTAVLPPLERDGDAARRLLDGVPVDFVVLDVLTYPGVSQRYAAPAVRDRPGEWKRVYVTPDELSSVYQRVRPPLTPAPTAASPPGR